MTDTSALARARSLACLPALVGLLMAIPAALVAQTGIITGKVTDGANGAPIADARVTIGGTALATITSGVGEYRLTNIRPGRVTVAVFALASRPPATRSGWRLDRRLRSTSR